ncbi:MAG TPA: hypothetical protein VIV01_25480 [Hyphomicrobiaceae bacterium]
MEENRKTAGEALGRVIESAGEAYKEFGGGRMTWDEVDLTARAWLWTNEAVRRPFEWNSRSQCMWLKDAVKEAVRRPLEVRNIEYEKRGGGTELMGWSTIKEIWEQRELWKK